MDFDDPTILELIEAADTSETSEELSYGSDSDVGAPDMQDQKPPEETPIVVQESSDLDDIGNAIKSLLDEGLAMEAMVRLSRLRTPDQGDVLLMLPGEHRTTLLSLLAPPAVGNILEQLFSDRAVQLSGDMESNQLSRVLDETRPDVAADVLRGLPDEVAIQALLGMQEASSVTPLLEYEDDAAGGLMTPDFIALRDNMTVMQAMNFIRGIADNLDAEDVQYLLIVDRNGVLKGGVSLSQLVLGRPYQRVSLHMHPEAISVPVETDREYCARLMERYNLSNLPVVDEEGKLVGVLKLPDMLGVIEEEATEDMYRMIGVAQEEKVLGPFWRSVRSRLPWLIVNLGTAVLAGYVVLLFQSTMAQVIALVAFLPVIAGQGGIAGTQTLTLIVRSLALGEITTADAKKLFLKEIRLGLVHGLALGLIVGAFAFVWKGSEFMALVVGISMMANLVVAGASGVIVPLGFKALRIDPALSSAVAVTTLTDVFGFLVYLGLATLTIGLILGGL